MKNILLLVSLLMVTSCGNDLRRAIGADYNNKLGRHDNRIGELERRVFEAESNIERTINDISIVHNLVTELSDVELARHQDLLDDLVLLQGEVNSLVASLAVLQGYDSIISMVDPCGDSLGYDEVLLVTVSGKYIAYFEQGSNRFLSVLGDGNYRTTDSQACNFSINSGVYHE